MFVAVVVGCQRDKVCHKTKKQAINETKRARWREFGGREEGGERRPIDSSLQTPLGKGWNLITVYSAFSAMLLCNYLLKNA